MDTITFHDIIEETRYYISEEDDIALIRKAYEYAAKHHEGQFRKSGDPYIVHALRVAQILAEMHTGPKTIAAGLLHDVIEDCGVTEEEFKEEFGEEVFSIVDAVTKIGKLKFTDEKEYQAANHRKIFIAMAKDIRVILVKLVDRLHNMRTLQYMKPEKQIKIARETLEVYAPIAHRLGMSEIKNELEDLSFRYLNKDKFYEIAGLVEKKKAQRDAQVQKMIQEIEVILDEHDIQYRIFGRSKHLYSIYKKMKTKHKRFEEILDLLAIRIVTDTKSSCYEILGYIHATYHPIPGRFKDYIAMPKMNMYQSLHTTIVADEGNIFEVQIRTEDMDEIAEHGVAAHWMYKEGKQYHPGKEQKEIEEQLHWFKDFNLLTNDAKSDNEFMDTITHDIFEANVYVMSPKGRVINLPSGSTPLDFAYRIHTEVGHQTVGATVNGVLVPLNTPLKTGDVVDIKTNKHSGPSEDWLNIVKSSHAKNKIRSYFIKQQQAEKEEGIQKGKVLFEAEMKKRGYDLKDYDHKKIDMCAGNFNLKNANELYYAIYCKSVTLQSAVEKLTRQKASGQALTNEELLEQLAKVSNTPIKKKTTNKYGINVAGIDSLVLTIASCCLPIPGDDIVGFITKGQGVKIHRRDCPNLKDLQNRLISASWDENIQYDKDYDVHLVVYSTDRNFLLSDIVTTVAQCKVNLKHVDSKVNEDGLSCTTKMTVCVKNSDHLHLLTTNLRKVISVQTVERVIL